MRLLKKVKRKLLDKLVNAVRNTNLIRGKVKIGKNSIVKGSELSGNIDIGENCKIRYCTISGKVSIGRYTALAGRNIELMSAVNSIEIGSFCSIASNTLIQEFNHSIDKISTFYIQKHIFNKNVLNDRISKGSIIVGNDVWIGKNAILLSGVKVGNGAIIAANAVVTKEVPPYAIVGGIPAKVIKFRFDEEVIVRLLELEWWDWSIEKIRKNSSLFQKNKISKEDLDQIFN